MVFLNSMRLLLFFARSCVSFNENEMANMKQDVNEEINVIGYNDHCVMTIHDVVDAVARIKSGIHDGYLGLSSDRVNMHATSFIFTCLSCLPSFIIHGSLTDNLSSSTVLPIPKGKN